MFSKLQGAIIGVVVVFLCIGGYVWHLNSIIDDKDKTISEFSDKNVILIKENADADAANTLLENNNKDLSSQLDSVNAYTESFEKQLEESKLEILKWKNKPPSIKYKTKVKRIIEKQAVSLDKPTLESCEELYDTLKAVRENIKYEDL